MVGRDLVCPFVGEKKEPRDGGFTTGKEAG